VAGFSNFITFKNHLHIKLSCVFNHWIFIFHTHIAYLSPPDKGTIVQTLTTVLTVCYHNIWLAGSHVSSNAWLIKIDNDMFITESMLMNEPE
jgi:hypothetical protein